MNCDFLHFEESDLSIFSDIYERGWFRTAFHSPEYWSAITGNNWQILIVSDGGRPVALMPLQVKRKFFIKYYWQPPFMLYANPVVLPFSYKNNYEKFSRLRKIYEVMADFLVRNLRAFSFQCVPEFSYVLPFVWKGANASVRTTFVVEDFQGDRQYSSVLRRKLRKAHKEFSIVSERNFEMFKEVYLRSGKNFLDASRMEILRRLLENTSGNIEQRNVLNTRKEVVGSAIFLRGMQEDYYLLGVQNRTLKETAIGLLLAEALEESSKAGKRFNFEGSHIEPVERFFRSFGAAPEIYPEIRKGVL